MCSYYDLVFVCVCVCVCVCMFAYVCVFMVYNNVYTIQEIW